MNDSAITTEMLEALRKKLEKNYADGSMSEKRYRHTLEVEKMAARLGALFVPEKENVLRAAGLLHDVTKEYSADLQIAMAEKYKIELTELDRCAPKTLHAMTAAASIAYDYPEFDNSEVVSAVRWHTTGHADMTLCEKLVYLADYIDMTRTFDDCVKLREYFFCDGLEDMSECERLRHLDKTLLISYDITLEGLIEKKAPISPDTIAARNELAVKFCLEKIAEKKNKN